MKLSSILMLLLSTSSFAAPQVITYADLEGRDESTQFAYAVLKLSLEKSGVPFELKKSKREMSDARVSSQLTRGSFDVAWLGSSPKLEEKHTYVPIPITRGLLGKRVFVINGKNQSNFTAIKTLADLKKMKAGLGIGWPITTILESNSVPVNTVSKFKSLFKMVTIGRVDYLPFGANESQLFVDQFKGELPELKVENNVILNVKYYDFFFFLNKKNQRVRDLITKGFETAYQDGSYMKLFKSHPEHRSIGSLNIKKRVSLDIDNPFATKAIKSIDQKYWE